MGLRLLLTAFLLLTPLAPRAETVRVGDLAISAAWAAPSSLSRRTGSVYLTIANAGTQDDRLIAANTAAAEETELRSHRTGDVVGRARRVSTVMLPAGKATVLRPGAEHIALIDVKAPLTPGDSLSVFLMFQKSGVTTITVPVATGAPKD
ncbi:MAG: copper chaperone PCu(A)C [Alphaproteobacteria bacterium]|nr:copper chaperone PCu(A)C [Alphaproteobacteria bacterium]